MRVNPKILVLIMFKKECRNFVTASVLIENQHQTVTLTSWHHGTWTAYY